MAVDDPNDRGQWPNNVGQRRTVEAINGAPMTYTIDDEILLQQSGLPEKVALLSAPAIRRRDV